jgi:hypothetical protein
MSWRGGWAKKDEKMENELELKLARKHAWRTRKQALEKEFERGVRLMISTALDLEQLEKSRPEGEMFYRTAEFTEAIKDVEKLLAILAKVFPPEGE